MQKEIRIVLEEKQNEDGSVGLDTRLETKGDINPYELLGILRFFEKDIWVSLATQSKTKKTD